MAQNTSHRRILATPDTQSPIAMYPTLRKPKPNPSAAKNHHHPPPPPPIHPLPDPALTHPPSTIQNISNRFSKLYANHKKLVPHPSKPGPHPQPDPHFQTDKKIISFSPVSDSSCTTFTKSSSQRERHSNFTSAVAKILEKNEKNYYLGSKTKVSERDGDFKNPSSEIDPKISSFEALMSKGLGIEEGLLNEGSKRRSSLSSIPPVVNGGGGRRRSFCNSQVELADFLARSGVKIVAVDMPPFMQVHAVNSARKAHDSLEKFTSKTLACTLKKEFDGVYGPAWHCIVGTSFGSFVTHSVGGFMYFSMDHKLYILLFKTTVQRAE
ncbi:hypothetical protein CASFOL_015608 [Castilleja foliolosa]|uniref:Dynein light chain n=1 Tax=Castilleja foliolosa TaxID=1961234 RepID=A0ABD3DE73_9LAMI